MERDAQLAEHAVTAEDETHVKREGDADPSDVDELWPAVHDCLHQLAAHALSRERNGHTLQPTALVHEAWLRLSAAKPAHYNDAMHFQAVAARAVREVLVDHARRRAAAKRGGAWKRVTLSDVLAGTAERGLDVLVLEEAMQALTGTDARAAQVVELLFFGGMTIPEVALALEISKRTVDSDWQFARAWLMRALTPDFDHGAGSGRGPGSS